MTAAIALVLAVQAWAVGGTALDAVNFVTGARAAGSGGAATAAAVGPSALQWNPARLAANPGWSASLSHLLWVAGIRYSYAGLALPLARGAFGLPLAGAAGVSLQYLDYGTIEDTFGLKPAVSATDLGVTAGAGFEVGGAFAVGGAMKWFQHALAGGDAGEGALDAGVTYARGQGDERVTFALVFQNLGWAEALDGRRPPLPASLRGGVAYGFASSHDLYIPWAGEAFIPTVAVTYLLLGDVTAYEHKGPVNFRAGAEAGLNGRLFLRAGYLQSFVPAGRNAGASLGLGVVVSALRVDYAHGWLGELGRADYVTLTLAAPRAQAATEAGAPSGPAEGVSGARERVGPPPPVADPYAEALAQYAAKDYAGARGKAEAVVAADPAHWQGWQLLGHSRYAAGDRAGALEAYRTSLGLHPDNPELAAWIAQVEAVR